VDVLLKDLCHNHVIKVDSASARKTTLVPSVLTADMVTMTTRDVSNVLVMHEVLRVLFVT